MGNTVRSYEEFLEYVQQALVGAGGPDRVVRWEALLSESGHVGSLPSQIARDLDVPEGYVLSGVLDLVAWGTIRLRPAGLLVANFAGPDARPQSVRGFREHHIPHAHK